VQILFFYSVSLAVFSLTPGPIVVASVTFFRYCPFAADGLAFITALISVWKFSHSFCVPNET
jgi:hypothetical protein